VIFVGGLISPFFLGTQAFQEELRRSVTGKTTTKNRHIFVKNLFEKMREKWDNISLTVKDNETKLKAMFSFRW